MKALSLISPCQWKPKVWVRQLEKEEQKEKLS